MTDTHTETTEHLICPWCQYDLFGLPADGNLVRCPECGNRSDLRLLRIPADERERRLRYMESMPALASWLFVFGACAGVLCVAAAQWELAVILLPFALGWVAAVWTYARSCSLVVGWLNVLAVLHLCALLLSAGIFLTLLGTCLGSKTFSGWPLSLLLLCVGLAMLAAAAWLYQRTRGILRAMHDRLAGVGERWNP